jgi:DNA adenine methylase
LAASGREAAPFLKWAGGKQQLLEQFEKLFPARYSRYVEPFLGSGAVFFHLVSKRPRLFAALMDNNAELIATYEAVRDEVEEVIAQLCELKLQHSPEQYYAVRAQEPSDPAARAARFIYLNKTCFNGLYRVNRRGQFNVPMGRYRNPGIFAPKNLRCISQVLTDVSLRVAHFSECVKVVRETDFVYFDPPYHPLSTTSSFTSYTSAAFGEAEQRQLADVYRELAERGCQLMLSNSDTPFVRELYKGFRIETVRARRYINSKGDKRGAVTELVVRNY